MRAMLSIETFRSERSTPERPRRGLIVPGLPTSEAFSLAAGPEAEIRRFWNHSFLTVSPFR
jgi:hypothetical protein